MPARRRALLLPPHHLRLPAPAPHPQLLCLCATPARRPQCHPKRHRRGSAARRHPIASTPNGLVCSSTASRSPVSTCPKSTRPITMPRPSNKWSFILVWVVSRPVPSSAHRKKSSKRKQKRSRKKNPARKPGQKKKKSTRKVSLPSRLQKPRRCFAAPKKPSTVPNASSSTPQNRVPHVPVPGHGFLHHRPQPNPNPPPSPTSRPPQPNRKSGCPIFATALSSLRWVKRHRAIRRPPISILNPVPNPRHLDLKPTSPAPPQAHVISTGAAHSFIVRCAVERPLYFAVAFVLPRSSSPPPQSPHSR